MLFKGYKKKQGAIVRWSSFGLSALLFLFGAYKFYEGFPYAKILPENRTDFWKWFYQELLSFRIPLVDIAVVVSPRLIIAVVLGLVMLLLLAYLMFRQQRISDFLIDTESEMRKVAWPTRSEVLQSSVVVVIFIFLLGVYLFVVDIGLSKFFNMLFF